MSGDEEALALSPDRRVTWSAFSGPDEEVDPEIVLAFHDLCLVKPVDDDQWYMGDLKQDGSVLCWSAYDGLYEALRGL
ncbi:hypothetical protein K7396_06745 [Streptomyces angustmyceticus]|uniref:Uncharacterized protein n=1 Tax=Streptomyces angustmyceticus TaxID=285578 RepID=A0A5J4L8I5_9ACTN|nr:hypothetical protein K7396_06745 [Streptomyces angustmyceticus]GES28964.1 hypothetical protein San01_14510 [Streptomyces angustmyceticus]